jgi:hypothetical protein
MKMDRVDRAKQFMPFDALRGLCDVLRERERIIVPKMDLSEEMKNELDWKLHQLQLNDIITMVYFQKGEYVKVTGMVSGMDTSSRMLRIVNIRVPFDDIADIKGDRFAE